MPCPETNMKACIYCIHFRGIVHHGYRGRIHGYLCKKHSSDPPGPAKYFPTELVPDETFNPVWDIPEWCESYRLNKYDRRGRKLLTETKATLERIDKDTEAEREERKRRAQSYRNQIGVPELYPCHQGR